MWLCDTTGIVYIRTVPSLFNPVGVVLLNRGFRYTWSVWSGSVPAYHLRLIWVRSRLAHVLMQFVYIFPHEKRPVKNRLARILARALARERFVSIAHPSVLDFTAGSTSLSASYCLLLDDQCARSGSKRCIVSCHSGWWPFSELDCPRSRNLPCPYSISIYRQIRLDGILRNDKYVGVFGDVFLETTKVCKNP